MTHAAGEEKEFFAGALTPAVVKEDIDEVTGVLRVVGAGAVTLNGVARAGAVTPAVVDVVDEVINALRVVEVEAEVTAGAVTPAVDAGAGAW